MLLKLLALGPGVGAITALAFKTTTDYP